MERNIEELREKFKDHPLVVGVSEDGDVILTLEFRQKAYDAWELDKRERVVRQMLIKEGLGPQDIGYDKARRMVHGFRTCGRPQIEGTVRKKVEIPEGMPRRTIDELVELGVLIPKGKGVGIPEWLYQKMRDAYPEKIADEILIEEGVDPRDFGAGRLCNIRKKVEKYSEENLEKLSHHEAFARTEDGALSFTRDFRGELCDIWEAEGNYKALYEYVRSKGIKPDSSIKGIVRKAIASYKTNGHPSREWTAHMDRSQEGCKSNHEEADSTSQSEDDGDPYIDGFSLIKMDAKNLRLYTDSPFTKEVERRRIVFNDIFYETASDLVELGVDDILEALNFSPHNFYGGTKARIKEAIEGWETTGISWPPEDGDPAEMGGLELVILTKLNAAYDKLIEREYRLIGKRLKKMTRPELKKLCQWIKGRPKDPGGKFTIQYIISLVGISNNSFYCYNRIERYGLALDEKDRLDGELVRQAFDYKGYKKGYRQVSMVLRTVFHKPMGVDKVRRIMRKEGLECCVRVPSLKRQAIKDRQEVVIKPNILKRKFKLYRPNKVRVTDVTYLDYGHAENGEKKRAYGSALMDPVTSRLIVFNVSGSNDLEFAMETLELSKSHPCINGGIFHSDQGILYQTDDFQAAVREMGFVQSMSKRGNCWDNATQESFFGHFKDECQYTDCETIEELKECIAEYVYYYNNERGVWGNRHMTPVEYEEYLLSLPDDEFDKYIARETRKYDKMKAEAAEKAKKRSKTLGV